MVICVDGTKLSGNYFGTLLVAYTSKAENHIFPVASAVVQTENKDSWSWFLTQMWDAIIDMEHDLVVISDRQKGLMNAVPLVLSNVYHSYRLLHLTQNLYRETMDSLAKKHILTMARQPRLAFTERCLPFSQRASLVP